MSISLLKKILVILIFLTLSLPAGAQTVLPTGKMEYEFVYDRLQRTQALARDYFDYQLGPYGDHQGQFHFGPFDYLRDLSSNKLTMFSLVGEDFYSAEAQSAEGFESVRGGFAARPVDRLFAYGNLLLDERRAEDESYTGKKWRGLAGGVEQAFVRINAAPFEITIGRFASFWGPRNSLVLSSRHALDGLAYRFNWGRLVLSYHLAKLDGLNPDDDDVEEIENRFLAAHRLDIHFARNFQLGLFEAVIYGGPGRQVDLLYLNPIVFFHSDQLNEGIDDNTLLGFDFSYVPTVGLQLYGQLLVDDFQIEKSSQGDQEPDQYGVIAGGRFVDVMPRTDVELEYSRVSNWTFNQVHPRNRFLFNSDPIGAAPGNDYDRWSLSLTRWFDDDMAVSTHLSGLRQGEGRVTDPWTAPWLEVEGDYSEPFPTGVVEKTKSASLRFKGFFLDHFYLDLEAGAKWIDNYRHVESDDRSVPFVHFKLSTFFSSSVRVD